MAADHPGRAARAPAWYPDPARSGTLRYWDGGHWTSRRRSLPRWLTDAKDIAVADGAQRPAELPAPAAGVSTSREGGSPTQSAGPPGPGGASDVEAVAPIHRPADDGPPGPGGPDRPGGDGGDGSGGDGRGRRSGRRRRMWFLISAIGGLAAIAVGLTAWVMRPQSYGPRVLTDAHFITAANSVCSKTIPTLRPPYGGPFGTTATPAQAADQIDGAATGLDQLAGQLRALPAAQADRPHISGWLDNWDGYITLGRQYATFLRQHAFANPGHLARDASHQATLADHFALANGLKSCTFSYTPQPDPSNGI